jgi:spore germination protein
MSPTNQHLLDSSLNSAEMEIIMTEKIPVSKRLSENIAQMEQFFHECDDIKKKEMMLGRQMDVPCYLTFIEVSVDMGTSALGEVLKHLNGLEKDEIYQVLEKNALGISDATYFDTIEDAVDGLLTGEVILFVEGFDQAVKIPDDGYPNMGITEADSEKVIRGSNEGFCDEPHAQMVFIT